MTVGINIKNEDVFAWNSFAKQNRTTSIILILKVSVILKNSRKRLNLKGLNSNKMFLSEKGRLIKCPVAIATTIWLLCQYHTNYRIKTVSVWPI